MTVLIPNAYQPKNILITGGLGFIGSNFVHYVLQQDANVRVINLDAVTYAGDLENVNDLPDFERHHFVKGDITDANLIHKILREYQIDTIIHFAAESHVDRSITGPSAFVHSNVVGTFTLLEAARQYWLVEKGFDHSQCRFHHISTDEVYGTLGPNDPAFSEQTAYAPNSPYSASKASSDHFARAYFHTYQLPVTISNCSNNYGPRQNPEKLIPTIIRSALAGQPIPVYGDGSNIRDWLYVDDHCDAIWQIVQRGHLGEAYNIGGNNEWNNLDIVRHICGLLDELSPADQPYESLIQFVTDRPGHDWRYAIDAQKIQQELAWFPKETFETGIRKTVEWCLLKQK
jgi:dTDP-glucose 4,6-dehydratase